MQTAVQITAAEGRGAGAPVPAAVAGASGYAGGELLALLARHPFVSVACLMALATDGKESMSIEAAHPKLRGRFRAACEPLEAARIAAAGAEVVFLATPHEASLEVVPALLELGLRVVDLSGAFRLKEAAAYARWYGFEHKAAAALAESVYGLPEFEAPAIRRGRLVANPGCYPTSVILALAPLLRAGWADRSAGIVADSKSGATGAGRKPTEKLHFPEVNENLRAYSLFHHRHVPEMLQALELSEGDFTFTPHLLPITRGILSTVYARLAGVHTAEEVERLYRQAYAEAPMVRVYPAGTLPEIQGVAGTQFADIGFALDAPTRRLIVVSALDNLGKGAAGQAVQNFNLMWGFPQETGLL